MFARTSKSAGRHNDVKYPYTEYANLTKYKKLEIYDELARNVIDRQNKIAPDQYAAMRAVLKLVHFYPVIKTSNSDFLAAYPSRWDFILSLVGNSRSTVYFNKLNSLADDVNHIEKIMLRYQLDFDKAFDFFVLNNLLRTDFKYRGNTGTKIYEVADEMLYSRLLETAGKACISESQLKAIIPALMSKIACSESKVLIAKHKASMFNNNTGQFMKNAEALTKELDACVKKYESRRLDYTR
ncbi:MAG TPA: hypothetical protein VL360_07750 [Gammaproteobacteria bacterium]|jgi:hypothetical protein|nr:hypothetical protein [Gammaproteobacteria bacterium]